MCLEMSLGIRRSEFFPTVTLNIRVGVDTSTIIIIQHKYPDIATSERNVIIGY